MYNVLIVGANSNIGSKIAEFFLGKADNLFLWTHGKSNSEKLSSSVNSNVKYVYGDISDEKVVESVFLNDLAEFRIDTFINCATLRSSDFKPLSETSSDLWKKIFDVNVLGLYYLLHKLIPNMRTKGGNIILFGSNVSRIGLKNGSAYAASKAAIANLTRTIALEEAQNKILINTISPGPVLIDDSHFSEDYRAFRNEYYKKELSQIPIGRLIKIEEIISLIEFLSFKNSYMTGEEIFLTGGKL
jgi:NAD(P)-dependent dehydrogenase (short-subunit alcohol dehydrogenase family)